MSETPVVMTVPVGEQVLGRIINARGHPLDDRGPLTGARQVALESGDVATVPAPPPTLFETGIKVIDLFAPITRGGVFGMVAPGPGLGKHVTISELAHHLTTHNGGYVVVIGRAEETVEMRDLVSHLRESGALARTAVVLAQRDDATVSRGHVVLTGLTIAAEFGKGGRDVLVFVERGLVQDQHAGAIRRRLAAAKGAVTVMIYDHGYDVPIDGRTPLGSTDGEFVFSLALGQRGIWPAIDPLGCSSRLLTERRLDPAHVEVAEQAQALLGRYRNVLYAGTEAIPETDAPLLARARRVQLFQTQPFFVVELYTAIPAAYVPVAETVQGFRTILDGGQDATPEDKLRFLGALAPPS
jgi:F-type H+-transporting ATPase subunit beta